MQQQFRLTFQRDFRGDLMLVAVGAVLLALGGRVIPAGVPDDPETCLVHPLQADDPAEMLLAARFLITALSGEAALSAGAQAAPSR